MRKTRVYRTVVGHDTENDQQIVFPAVLRLAVGDNIGVCFILFFIRELCSLKKKTMINIIELSVINNKERGGDKVGFNQQLLL